MTCPPVAIEAPAPPDLGAPPEDLRRWAAARSAWASQLAEQLAESEACYRLVEARAVRAEGKARAASLELAAAHDDAAWWEREARRPRVGLLVAGLGVGIGLGLAGGVVLAR